MSVARIIALAFSAITTQVSIWTSLECSIGIIVACCPALRLLFRPPEDRTQSVMFGTGSHHGELASPRGGSEHSIKPLTQSDKLDKVSAEFHLVEASNGQYIFKSVDFEIMSERNSVQTPRPFSRRNDEMGWESAARRKGL